MSEIQINDIQNKLIRSIAKKEDFVDYEITLNSGSNRGDNYLGVITTVLLKDRATSRELSLVLKSAIQNKEARKQTPIRSAYGREIFIYEQIFKAYEDLQKENNVKNPFKAYAKYYGSSLEDLKECLVLQNMKAIGYKMWNRKEPMNADHIAKVFTEYGKLHGVSMALKYKKPELFNDLKKNMKNIFLETMSDEFMTNFITTQFNKLAEDLKERQVSVILRKYIDERLTDYLNEVKDAEEFGVFTHGDCWTNNMLFKYDDEKDPSKPTDLCLIDWQISHYVSPIHDLAYFFFVCSPKEILYEYKTYLKIYYKSLSSTLTEFGFDPESIMTYDQCEEQWNKYCRLGLHIAMTLLKLMVSESEETVTVVELAESKKDIVSAFDYVSKNEDIYKKRITDIVMFLHENDLLMS